MDWIPLATGAVRSTQDKTLTVIGCVGRLAVLQCRQPVARARRWMRTSIIPNQSSVAKAFLKFDDAGRMKPSACRARL